MESINAPTQGISIPVVEDEAITLEYPIHARDIFMNF